MFPWFFVSWIENMERNWRVHVELRGESVERATTKEKFYLYIYGTLFQTLCLQNLAVEVSMFKLMLMT